MTRRAQMLALLQLSSLVFLLVVELTHAAPVSDVSNINTIPGDGDRVFSEKHNVTAHTEDKPGDSEAESDHYTAFTQDVSMSKEDSMVTKSVNVLTSTEENVEKDVGSSLNNSEDEVSEENVHNNKEFLSVKSGNNVDATDGSSAESEANVDKHEDSPVTEGGENGKVTESINVPFEEKAGMHKDHSPVENEGVTNTRETSVTVSKESVEENEDPMITEAGENTNNAESKEKESHEDSGEFLDTFKDTEVEKNSVESSSSDKRSEENKEDGAVKETASLNSTNSSEDEVSEESNKEKKSENSAALGNSSEETSDAENEAEDIELNENHSRSPHESHITGSPYGRLSLPSSDDDHIKKDEQLSDKNAAMKEYESNPSVEEMAENEAGSPDDLIENDKVDSEVLKNHNKTAALGKHMPITKAEEDAQNKDESLQDTSKISLTELENTEGKNSIEHQDPTTMNGAPENTHEKELKETVLDGELLGEENEKDNSLDKDDMHSGAFLMYSFKKNEEGSVVAEETVNTILTTENPSEDEGSGITPDEIAFPSHGENTHKDVSETGSQEKHEAEIRDRKEGSKDEAAMVFEKKDTKLTKESGHHIDAFGYSGSGDEEEHGPLGKQANNRVNDVDDNAGSGGNALPGQYDDMISEEHTTISNGYSIVPHIPIVGDDEESSVEYSSESPAPEYESSTKIASFENASAQNESGDHFKEENLAQNNTNVQVMSMNPTNVPDVSDNHYVTFDGSGDDDTPLAIIVSADVIDDNMDMDLNSSAIGEASPAYQEKPAEKVILPHLAGTPPPPTTEPLCIKDEENDCLILSNKTHENAGLTNIFEDDDEISPEPTKAVIDSKSTSDNDLIEIEAVISTTPAVKVSSEEESLPQSISVEHNKPLLHPCEEISSSTIAPEVQEITEPVVDQEVIDNEMGNISTPDTVVEHPLDEAGTKEMSGKIRAVNVNELGISGQENSDDLGEPEALDSSSASGSYVVLGCIMAVVVILLAYATIKSRRERGTNTNSKKQSEVAGDDDDGTELKDMKKALLPPETPHDDRNGDIEANRKPLMDKDEKQEEDEEKEPIIKQNGTLELSEPPRDIESQVDSSTAENQPKTLATPNKPQQRNGLSEVVVEKPAISNGKADSIITHPVSAKVKVIENEDSIAKTPVIINRGGNSPPH